MRVNAIAPGSIDTPMIAVIEHALGGNERLAVRFAAQRRSDATKTDSAARTRSPRSSRSCSATTLVRITGATVPIDGGTLAADPYRLPTTVAS